MQRYEKIFIPQQKSYPQPLVEVFTHRDQTFIINVKTPYFNLTKDLSSPTVVGVGKELVGLW